MTTNGQHSSGPGPPTNSFEESQMTDLLGTSQDSSFMDEMNDLAGMPGEEEDAGNELEDILGEGGGNMDLDLNTLNDRQVGEEGEKADNAEDFADISDDDLAEEDAAKDPPLAPGTQGSVVVDDDDMADLFGEGLSSPPSLPQQLPVSLVDHSHADSNTPNPALDNDDQKNPALGPSALHDASDQQFVDPEWLLQQATLAEALKPSKDPEQRLEEAIEICKGLFPEFRRDEVPYWNRIIVPRLAEFTGKTPFKPPKPIRPTKVHLEVQQDQKAGFNSAITPDKPYWDDQDRILVIEDEAAHYMDDESIDDGVDVDEVLPGGLTMEDLDMVCADFDTLSSCATSEADTHGVAIRHDEHDDSFGHDDDWIQSERPTKRVKLDTHLKSILSKHQYKLPAFDEPEYLTEKVARKVVLDLNDPQLLTEEVDPATLLADLRLLDPNKGAQNVKDSLRGRFNYSNDADYDLLKQNHQHKIRSTLGNLAIEHSVPALRLQYPYYQVKLSTAQARTFHRPNLTFRPMLSIHFSKANRIKRKHQKGKKATELYASTKDLTFGDNSSCLILEYSEEHPMMLSQVGMGSRIINYYRRQTKDDALRPKLDIGETAVLLPEDKSPFSIFGNIDPGETVTAVYNSMYRAPIFEHQAKSHDFLVTRSHTGMLGSQFFMRKVDHIYAVGQEFPSVAIPGPHSRVVTTASKNRLKMVSYRIARRKKNHRLNVGEVTKHFPETTDMQNRQKMKEFMVYSKEHKEWEMRPGDTIPNEEQLRQLVRPEDVCLLESMQVGQQYLHDAGFGDDGDEEDDDKEGQGGSLEQELAPWKTSKNFLHASQGKAMLTLHGDGDPSGRGEAFALLKTSMKGGFKAIGESAMSKMEEKKELGGHSYNVARQQRAYDESIHRIWNAQKATLSSKAEHSDVEMDDNVDGPDEDGQSNVFARSTAQSEPATPAAFGRRDDESATSFSKRSTTSNTWGRVLRITRQVPREDGVMEEVEHIERDAMVIKQYLKKRNAKFAATRSLGDVLPTGDAEQDAADKKRLAAELARLERNRERRYAREKAKGITTTSPSEAGGAGSPAPSSATTPVVTKPQQGTQRKCANCGQVGHIKTNKKLCPLLNGTIKQDTGPGNAAFMGMPPAMP